MLGIEETDLTRRVATANEPTRHSRIVVVSNRLPVTIKRNPDEGLTLKPSSGGLVTALAPVLRDKGGLWIGWPGVPATEDLPEFLSGVGPTTGFELRPVPLSQEEVSKYYHGFSNEVVWPLFHDLQSRCNFDPAYWQAYQSVNRKFAEQTKSSVRPDDYVWVQDYHLMLAGREMRSLGMKNPLGFFLHTPFPSPDIFVKLPWAMQVLSALLEYDVVGLQTPRDKRNFIECVDAMTRASVANGRRRPAMVETSKRVTRVSSFPISIDFRDFARRAASEKVGRIADDLKKAIPGSRIVLGVDRLDYSKGVPEKLRAFSNALERYPELRGRVTLVQLVVPSREEIPRYQELKAEIEGLASNLNGRFTQAGWVPVQYMYRHLDSDELLAHYRMADVAMVTPLKDGMNLVAKEYCACNLENDGVLILSQFAGAASQLQKSSLMVNPYDVEGVANALHRACNMDTAERRSRMRKLRKAVARRDIYWWVDSFLSCRPREEAAVDRLGWAADTVPVEMRPPRVSLS